MKYSLPTQFNIILSFIIFSFLLPTPSKKLQAQTWSARGKLMSLSMDRKKVFLSNVPLKKIPALDYRNKIRFLLTVSEYYLNRNDKENVANILYLIRTSKEDFRLVDAFINAVWFLDRNDRRGAGKKLDTYIRKETSLYRKTIAKAIKYMLTNKSSTKTLLTSVPEVGGLSCNPKLTYYTFCNLIKLQVAMQQIEKASDNYYQHYTSLNRLLASFRKRKKLSYIYFLDRLLPSIGPKLAFLGFASEAAKFQQIQIQSEKLSTFFNVVSYERKAFYHMLAGDLAAAEKTLQATLPKLRYKRYLKNIIYLRLAAIAHFRKDYQSSLKYYLSLNFKNWGKRIRNPFFDKPLTIHAARDLIAISIWKAKSASKAIAALSKIKTSRRVTVQGLFVKLRIAHIMMHDRPDITQKISNEIIYQAQGKGWRRVEYAATLMNGFSHILLNNNRKAIIQFTKSYGILGKSDPFFASEWTRKQGLFRARLKKRQYSAVNSLIGNLLNKMKLHEYDKDIMSIKHYIDDRFNIDSFFHVAADYYTKKRKYQDLLYLFYSFQKFQNTSLPIAKQGLVQIPGVDRRLAIYKGFRPLQDNYYLKSTWNGLRKKVKTRMNEEFYRFDRSFYKKTKQPFVTCVRFHKDIYVISYAPQYKRWYLKQYNLKKYGYDRIFRELETALPFLKKGGVQVYMNHIGAELLQYLQKKYQQKSFRFFYNYSLNSSHSKEWQEMYQLMTNAKESRISYHAH
ncbi:MAG: hypothetical protein AAF518_14585 [Spirochaetota bacterium]